MDSSHFIRIGLIVLCLLVAPVFPFSLAAAAFLGWTIWQDFQEPKSVPPEGWVDIDTLTAASEGWLEHFRARCESPAEDAFLMAMVQAFQLEPKAGALAGQGLSLKMQVPVPPYRLDFLVDKRLVVEVDGAAYHSSPEAVENDRRRDEFLRSKGHEVLRIPAKITLQSPDVAVDRVRKARLLVAKQDRERAEKRQEDLQRMREGLRPANILATLKGAAEATARTIDEIATKADKIHARNMAEEAARTKEVPRPQAEEPDPPRPETKAVRMIGGFREDEIPF